MLGLSLSFWIVIAAAVGLVVWLIDRLDPGFFDRMLAPHDDE